MLAVQYLLVLYIRSWAVLASEPADDGQYLLVSEPVDAGQCLLISESGQYILYLSQ
jgi:hypothetical protein